MCVCVCTSQFALLMMAQEAERAALAAALRREQEISTKLSVETDTIGEYIVLYQQQRAVMQSRMAAKDDYIRRCTGELTKLTATVSDLQQRLAMSVPVSMQTAESLARSFPLESSTSFQPSMHGDASAPHPPPSAMAPAAAADVLNDQMGSPAAASATSTFPAPPTVSTLSSPARVRSAREAPPTPAHASSTAVTAAAIQRRLLAGRVGWWSKQCVGCHGSIVEI